MAKIMVLDVNYIQSLYKDFVEYLKNSTFADGKINFQRTLGLVDDKAELRFSELAWIKMQRLVQEKSKEVAWHGVAFRNEDEPGNVYFVKDILIYPQEVTGTNVETDQAKYETWLMSQEDDVFNNIRFQGHSHVNMGTTPSAVDTTHQQKILEQVEGDMFYIFVIWNKRNEKFIRIYDMKKNRVFDTTDVTVTVQDDGLGIESFLREADTMVQERTYAASSKATPNYGTAYGNYGNGYSSYGNNYGGTSYQNPQYVPQTPPASQVSAVPTVVNQTQDNSKKSPDDGVKPVKNSEVDTSGKKRRGHRCDKGNRSGRSTVIHMGGGNACDFFDQDGPYKDENDPRSAFGHT